MTIEPGRLGYGITGDLDLDIVRRLAPEVERAGLRTLWVNQPAHGDALAVMAAAAEVTSTLRIASGVLPVDRLPADEIVRRVSDLDLPADRLVLGVGASAPPSPITTVREAVATLTDRLGAPVVVGALGPRMRRLAARESAGLLLNWLTPSAAGRAATEKDRDVAGTGADPEVALYVRCALGGVAHAVVRREAERYAGIPSYAANFARFGFAPLDAAVLAAAGGELRAGLAPYTSVVDETVVRAVTASGRLGEHVALLAALEGAE
ncbi:luciferase-like monooxygenase [Georgenia soli]|uniref:Luciferase-like monooxygenase n=1 Tax=Georgenia soli TaxID=638953 RepID=A0A2A9EM92_9MICO|nr:LLM class flavin-dependent oxidoreductase [Georgenia soli]PFG39329.1 luciferase-like monooxygenase [Georgenia soli]